MAYNLVRLRTLLPNAIPEKVLESQLAFLSGEAKAYPAGHTMFLMALSDVLDPPKTITVVQSAHDDPDSLMFSADSGAVIRVLDAPTEEYRLLDGETAIYICDDHRCQPPINMQTYMAGQTQN